MPFAQSATTLQRRRALGLIAAGLTVVAASPYARAEDEDSPAYAVEVGDVTAKVGEPAVMVATLRIQDGYTILKGYNNRLFKLSSWDDSVVFDEDTVRAKLQDDALVFTLGLRATKPGKHPINGLFRVGFIHGPGQMSMVTLRLIANVSGTE